MQGRIVLSTSIVLSGAVASIDGSLATFAQRIKCEPMSKKGSCFSTYGVLDVYSLTSSVVLDVMKTASDMLLPPLLVGM